MIVTRKILRVLSKRYVGKEGTLLSTIDDTLIATMLSAQTTDALVLKIFPAFRKRFPDWDSLCSATLRDIERVISSVNFFRMKARALKETACRVRDMYAGTVPRTMEELVTLRGVGRKTASIILSACFDTPAIAVDTHVLRLTTRRWHWSHAHTPARVEQDLRLLIPKKLWSVVNRVCVPFGREFCTARSPKCWKCPISHLCPYEKKTKM